jgi:hypothetical protein
MISIFFIAGSFPHFFWSTVCLQLHLLIPKSNQTTIICHSECSEESLFLSRQDSQRSCAPFRMTRLFIALWLQLRMRRTPEALLIIHPGSRSSGPDACPVALGKEHVLCQEFRRLIGESLGLKGKSMGAEKWSY